LKKSYLRANLFIKNILVFSSLKTKAEILFRKLKEKCFLNCPWNSKIKFTRLVILSEKNYESLSKYTKILALKCVSCLEVLTEVRFLSKPWIASIYCLDSAVQCHINLFPTFLTWYYLDKFKCNLSTVVKWKIRPRFSKRNSSERGFSVL
jgi:hypothetical protein